MKILVLAPGYPDNHGDLGLAYIRTRNVYYKEKGVDVDVVNFCATEDYVIDDINVYSLKGYINKLRNEFYDVLVCHAANIRYHYIFLKRFGDRFNKIVFFFHGHEVLKINKVYSKPYSFIKRNYLYENFQDIYDEFKFLIWRSYFKSNYRRIHFIFVSRWMKNQFDRWIKLKDKYLEGRYSITYNSVGKIFQEECYNLKSEKKYDFITIRAFLDGSKYAIDIVNNLAKLNPQRKFLLIGKGAFFNYYEKAENIDWIDRRLDHKEMIDFLNASKCALMPTRTDAQGVMMCEMATFGMPLITSDIPVCHEVFDGFENVFLINNEKYDSNSLCNALDNIKYLYNKPNKYFREKTCENEIEIMKKFISA